MSGTSRVMIQKMNKVVVVDFIDSAIMDMQQIQQISEELEDLVDLQNQKYILLDFTAVKFLSSQTLGMILKLNGKIVNKKGWLGICGLRKDLYKIFRLTRLDKLFNFYDNEQQALTAAETLF
jgi:anti-sigma B factor antagonist